MQPFHTFFTPLKNHTGVWRIRLSSCNDVFILFWGPVVRFENVWRALKNNSFLISRIHLFDPLTPIYLDFESENGHTSCFVSFGLKS